MQSFSPTQNPAEAWQAFVTSVGVGRLILLGVGGLVTSVLGIWVASLCVASEKATLGRAVKVLLLGFALWIGIIIIASVLVPVGTSVFGAGAIVGAIVAFLGIVLAIAIGVPMVIYEIGFWRGVGFVLVAVLVSGAMQGGLQLAVLGTSSFDTAAFQQAFAAAQKKPEDHRAEVEAVRTKLRERQADLERQRQTLEIRRKYLPSGNSKAREEYNRERQIYERHLQQLRAEAAELPPVAK